MAWGLPHHYVQTLWDKGGVTDLVAEVARWACLLSTCPELSTLSLRHLDHHVPQMWCTCLSLVSTHRQAALTGLLLQLALVNASTYSASSSSCA